MAFKYRPLTKEQLSARRDQKIQVIDPIILPQYKVYRPKDGTNYVRILPPTWDDYEHWAVDVWVHRGIGDNLTYLCLTKHLRQPCPVCEEKMYLDQQGDSEAAKQILARKSRVCWLLDRKDEDAGPQAWVYGYTIDEQIATLCVDERRGTEIDILHPDDGYDISFKRRQEKTERGTFPKTEAIQIDRDPSPISDDPRWQKYYLDYIEKHPIPEILQFFEYDHIHSILHGRNPRRNTTNRYDEDGDGGGKPASGRRAPPPGDSTEEAPPPRRTRTEAPPDAEEKPQGRRAPPPDEQEGQPQPRGRRAPPPDDAPDNSASSARAAIENLRDSGGHANGEEAPPPRNRRTAPPDDEEAPPPRRTRTTAPPDDTEEAPPRRRAPPPSP